MELFIIKQAHRVRGSEESFSEWSNGYIVDNEEEAKKDVEKFMVKDSLLKNEYLEWTYTYEKKNYYPSIETLSKLRD